MGKQHFDFFQDCRYAGFKPSTYCIKTKYLNYYLDTISTTETTPRKTRKII
jgi:hypothetical protein